MSSYLTLSLNIRDTATPALRSRMAALQNREPLNRAMGEAVEGVVNANFLRVQRKGNKFGAPSKGFYFQAADSTVVSADGSSAQVDIMQRGVRLQYLGGTVVPKNGHKWLTIPARAEAHGKRAAEVAGGYSGQIWLFGRNGPYAIAEKSTGLVLFWLAKSATIKADSSVLPTTERMESVALQAATAHLERVGGAS